VNITIVGGGFAGVKTALELLKDPRNKITLISDREDFQYFPALYHIASGKLHDLAWVPLGEIFAGRDNIEVVIDIIEKIDARAKTLKTASGATIEYDNCILALGSVTTYFGIDGMDKFSYGIKNYAEIHKWKRHLHEEITHDHTMENHYVVVGAGPTGIEVAANLRLYLEKLRKKYRLKRKAYKIDLIEAAPRVLPRMSERVSELVAARLKSLGVHVMTGKKVEKLDENHITVSGELIESHSVIWTSGVAVNPFFKNNPEQFNFAQNGKVVVNEYLQVNKHLWVLGDNAATKWSGLAQIALHDAKFVAGNIRRAQDGRKLKKYHVGTPQVVIPIGHGWSVYNWKKLTFTGWIGNIPRRVADFIGYTDILPLSHALRLLNSENKYQDDYFDAKS